MKEKKSLREAYYRAVDHSLEHPDILVYVLDKKGKRACVHISEFIVKEKEREGWSVFAVFENGRRM